MRDVRKLLLNASHLSLISTFQGRNRSAGCDMSKYDHGKRNLAYLSPLAALADRERNEARNSNTYSAGT